MVTPVIIAFFINGGLCSNLVHRLDQGKRFGKYMNVLRPARFFALALILVLMRKQVIG